jgi:predicted anti-sigma-YlaC factor YlaD
MECTAARAAVSTRLDGEDLAVEPHDARALDDHLQVCAECATWADRAARLRRAGLLRDLPDAPDLSPRVLAAAMPARVARRSRRLRRARILRALLAVTGTLLVAGVVVVVLLGPDAVQPAEHLTSTTGFWAGCVGLGLLTVAAFPRLAFGMAPVLATAATFLVIATLDDLATRHVHPVHETPTVVATAGVVALVLLIWPQRHQGAGREREPVPDADAPGAVPPARRPGPDRCAAADRDDTADGTHGPRAQVGARAPG